MRRAVPMVFAGVFLIAAIPLWIVGFSRGKGAFDQFYFHMPAVKRFVMSWPRVDVRDYESATTPGYHVLLAQVARFVSDEPRVLQVVASVFTIGLLWVFGRALAARAKAAGLGAIEAVALGLALVCSPYVFLPGVWLQPDNAAWLLVLALMLIGMRLAGEDRTDRAAKLIVLGGILAAVLVLVRQSHLWAVGLLWAGAWLGAAARGDGLLEPWRRSRMDAIVRTASAIIATIPAMVIVALFVRTWGGFTPPMFQKQISGGINWATPAFCLSLIGVYGVFFAAWIWPSVVAWWREAKLGVVSVVVLAMAIAALPVTTFLYEPRATGLWNVVRVLEGFGVTIAGRTTPLFLVLAPIGAVVVIALVRSGRGMGRWIPAAAIAGMITAQTVNPLCWQRYVEPLFLMAIALMCVGAARGHDGVRRAVPMERWMPLGRVMGPLALAGVMAVLSASALVYGEELRWAAPGAAGAAGGEVGVEAR
ncbi:MAG: hypothetical protein K2W85_08175 [Phycisphaerales bacterium]|nr:hypothetical protein [Phycisphaerales bacterium]